MSAGAGAGGGGREKPGLAVTRPGCPVLGPVARLGGACFLFCELDLIPFCLSTSEVTAR